MRGIEPSWRRLHAVDEAQIDQLAGVLIDCVEGGAPVGFMHPLARDRAVAFWRRVAHGVEAGERALLVAEDARGRSVEDAGASPRTPPRAGGGADASRGSHGARMRQDAAGTRRVTGGDAERLYERLGWERVGVIPGYALMPQGGRCDTTVFYRNLSS